MFPWVLGGMLGPGMQAAAVASWDHANPGEVSQVGWVNLPVEIYACDSLSLSGSSGDIQITLNS